MEPSCLALSDADLCLRWQEHPQRALMRRHTCQPSSWSLERTHTDNMPSTNWRVTNWAQTDPSGTPAITGMASAGWVGRESWDKTNVGWLGFFHSGVSYCFITFMYFTHVSLCVWSCTHVNYIYFTNIQSSPSDFRHLIVLTLSITLPSIFLPSFLPLSLPPLLLLLSIRLLPVSFVLYELLSLMRWHLSILLLLSVVFESIQ